MPIPSGTRVMVLMFVHPVVAVFMVAWLGFIGYHTLKDSPGSASEFWGLFAIGLALIAGGFYLETIKAKRLMLRAINDPMQS